MRRVSWFAVVAGMWLVLAGCQTTRPHEEEIAPPQEPVAGFEPAVYVSPLHAGEARYPNLFAPDSFAVWVGSEVSDMKRSQADDSGAPVDPGLDKDAAWINSRYIVIECHVQSAFSDSSIAYDASGFRGIDVYILTPEGQRIRPVQTVVASPVHEEQMGTLKKYERTNLLVFARRDFWVGRPRITESAPSVKLVLEGYNSQFYFEWPSIAGLEGPPPGVSAEDVARIAKTSFVDLYGRIRQLAHIFD